jgi:hypothetical protein
MPLVCSLSCLDVSPKHDVLTKMDDDALFLCEAERKAKQSFLREEVVEAGYPPEAFVAFCELQRGADVDLWSFEELSQCVAEFKKTYRPSEHSKENKEAKQSSKSQGLPMAQEVPKPPVDLQTNARAGESRVDLLYTLRGTLNPETELSSVSQLDITVSE